MPKVMKTLYSNSMRQHVNNGWTAYFKALLDADGKTVFEIWGRGEDGRDEPVWLSGEDGKRIFYSANSAFNYYRSLYPDAESVLLPYPPAEGGSSTSKKG